MEIIRLQSAVTSLMECGLCLGVYQDPRILPCGHTFCLRCLQKQHETSISDRSTFNTKCAICRVPWAVPDQGVTSLPKNFVAQRCSLMLPALHETMFNEAINSVQLETIDTQYNVPSSQYVYIEFFTFLNHNVNIRPT